MQGPSSLAQLGVLLVPLALLGCDASGEDATTTVSAAVFASAAMARSSPQESALSPQGEVLLERARRPRFGDLEAMREQRLVRVLVSYGKTNFFYDAGVARGFEYELLRQWEKSLNEGRTVGEQTIVAFLPTPFERLLDDLIAGKGDIAAAGLTVTPERAGRVAFTRPYITKVVEVVVSNRGSAGLLALSDLAGRRVVVRAGSSYAEHLRELSNKLSKPIDIELADRRLVTEDLLELVNAGAIETSVADRHVAEAWAGVLPELRIHPELAIHSGGEVAWAVRPESSELRAHLDAFIGANKQGTLMGNILLKRYFKSSRWIANPLAPEELAKLEELVALFQKYGDRYGFDWLALAAQGYQESELDQSKKSHAGAVGVMQLLPSTAADRSVNVRDIHLLENNIHAGSKYLAFLRDRYFDEPDIDPQSRVDFAWAAYNAGPARVRRLRAKAEERGLNPNRWFGDVERIAAEEIGRETVNYVANINKYYLAYRLQYDANQERQSARSGG